MNCQRAREFFPDLIDSASRPGRDTLSADAENARAHLANCPDCQRELAGLNRTLAALDALPQAAPSPALRRNFYALLEEEKHSAESARAEAKRTLRGRFSWWRWLAAPLGAAALLAGGFITGRSSAPVPLPETRTVAVADPETKRELQELRAKIDRLEAMNQLVAAAVQDQHRPANERLRGVLTSAAQSNPADPVITELIASLALDSSPNVRLRALEALYLHSDREFVRAGVLASLTRESNPLVQVAMIDFLAAARDTEARPTLERLSVNNVIDANVREAARRAMAQL